MHYSVHMYHIEAAMTVLTCQLRNTTLLERAYLTTIYMPFRPPEADRVRPDMEFNEETYIARMLLQRSIVTRPTRPPRVCLDHW
jgi:hypothetical protein